MIFLWRSMGCVTVLKAISLFSISFSSSFPSPPSFSTVCWLLPWGLFLSQSYIEFSADCQFLRHHWCQYVSVVCRSFGFISCLERGSLLPGQQLALHVVLPWLVSECLILTGTIRRNFSAQTSGEVRIRNVLKERFPQASLVKVVDISGGCGAMYEVHIESVEFKGKRLVQQHQMINQALKDEIQSMHGLRIFTAVPK
ncbi:bolA-like protein 3 isoform X1 [Mobula birostris]|uniref:bolA-like protein 3 isoform X1 n=1 Tax=Mobula birostris TaxID=1983395 RepID=UPI003B282013